MPKNFRERFLAEAGERPYEWAVAHGLSKDLVSAVKRGDADYQPIRRTLEKIARATGKSVSWWLTGEEGSADQVDRNGTASAQAPQVAGTVAAGSGRVDLRKLDAAIEALSQWERTRQVKVADDRRSAVIAILYDILVADEEESEDRIATVFRAIG